jgi:hypothetical protein
MALPADTSFSHLSLEDFKETGDESLAWESFEKKLSAYSFLKYLVQENDIHVDLPYQSETFCEEYSVFKTVAFESTVSSKTAIEQTRIFQ